MKKLLWQLLVKRAAGFPNRQVLEIPDGEFYHVKIWRTSIAGREQP